MSKSVMLCGLIAVLVGVALCLSIPVQAQDGGDPWAVLATIEAQATISAINAASNAGSAQSQAAQLEATAAAARARAAQQSALATRQAADYASAQVQAQATANAAVQATRAANEARATEQAISATATAIYQDQVAAQQSIAATATSQAIDAMATRVAYEVVIADTKRRSDFGTYLLYAAGILAMLVSIWFVIAWTRRWLGKAVVIVERLPPGSAGISEPVDVPFTPAPAAPATFPALPMPGDRNFTVRVIDGNGEMVTRYRQYIRQHGMGADNDEQFDTN